MNNTVQNILISYYTKDEQLKALSELTNDIELAKNIINGTYKYCKECDDYYLAKSFLHESERRKESICIYEDIINSGGNEYTDRYVNIHYEICPKGHRKEIDKEIIRKEE